MEVKVRIPSNETVSLKVDPQSPLRELKASLESKVKFPPEKQRLLYRGKVLDHNLALEDCDIAPGTFLDLKIALRSERREGSKRASSKLLTSIFKSRFNKTLAPLAPDKKPRINLKSLAEQFERALKREIEEIDKKTIDFIETITEICIVKKTYEVLVSTSDFGKGSCIWRYDTITQKKEKVFIDTQSEDTIRIMVSTLDKNIVVCGYKSGTIKILDIGFGEVHEEFEGAQDGKSIV